VAYFKGKYSCVCLDEQLTSQMRGKNKFVPVIN